MSNINQKSLKINFIMNAVLTLSSFIFPLITFPYVSRILLPVGTGKVSFATSIITYFSMFAQMGIPTYGIRACAKVRDDKEKLSKTVQEIMAINIVMCVLVYAVFFVAVFTVPRLHQEKNLFMIMSLMIIFNALGVEWLYKALEKYSYITVRSIAFKFIALLLMFALIHTQEDYVIYGGITIFAASASNILNFLNLRRYIIVRPMGNYNFLQHMKMIMVFFAMSIATTIYTNLDTVMLGFMTTNADVGYYNAAVKIKVILVSIVTSLGAVLLPRASYYIEKHLIDEFWRISKKALNFVFLAAIPMMVYFMLFAKEGILFLSGPAYTDSILPMQIIMPTLLFIGITNILGIQILVPMGKENIVLYSEIAGAIVDLVINILLIPSMHASGAALGTTVAEAVVLVVQCFALRSQISNLFREISYFKILIALGLAVGGTWWVAGLHFGNFIILIISAVLYFGIYGVVLLILKEKLTVEIVGSLLKRFRHR
jgi:O-antigen/teichoic acid export membrane protein